MKKLYILILFILTTLLLCSCSNKANKETAIWYEESIVAYLAESNRIPLYYEVYDGIVVMINSSENTYGISLLDKELSSGDIIDTEGTINHFDQAIVGSVDYQDTKYTVIYIEDNAIKKESAMVTIIFDDLESSDAPFKVQRTLNGLSGLVIEQELDDNYRSIKSISFLDDREYELLKIQADKKSE